MLPRLFAWIFIFNLILGIMAVEAAKIAVVDFADEWTRVDALRQTLDKFKIEYDDLTKALENGYLPFKAENRIFLIGSMTTNNATLHRNLDKNAKVIQDFVKNGGIVWAPTQADQNEANVDWLPPELSCVRSDRDSTNIKILETEHPLFNEPNRMTDQTFKGWGYRGWPTVWEVIASQKGFDVLMESLGHPVIMEAEFGKGKFLMMAIAPDKYYIVGKNNTTKDGAKLFMENLLNYVVEFADIGGVAPEQQPLITVNLSHKPLIVSPKKSLDLVATVENTGEVAAAVTLQFYGPVKVENSVTDNTLPTIDFTGKELGKAVNIKTLNAESKRNLGERTTFPDEPGTYAYKACIQRTDEAGETDEICSDVITVTVAQPDLQVKVWAELKLDKTWTKTTAVAPGEEFKLSATVSNDGGKSDRTALWFYLQNEDTGSAKELGGSQIYPLPTADGTTEVTKHITITAPETPGTYIYNASVDGFEGEEKSSNNYAEVTITVGGSDLVIESVQASHPTLSLDSLTLDDNEITLSTTVKNIGTTKSDSTTLRFYRSANEHISIDDTELATDVEVPPLDPQKTFTHSFKTKAEYATQYLQPSIYYYGALVGSPANEINTDNNWSDNIVKVTVNVITGYPYQGIYRLNVPPDLISEVAYSQGYTYFLLKAECFEVAGLEANADVSRYPYVYQNKNCAVRLYLPADNLSDDPVNNPAYFMFYVEAPRDELSNIAKEGAIEVFKSVIFTALGEVAGKIVDSVGGIFFASYTTGMQVGQIIMSYQEKHGEAEDQTPTVIITDPKKSRLCLILVPGRLSSVEVNIVQNYKYLIVDDENPGGTISDLTKAHYGNTWNLEEIWRLENPDLAAAPGAPSMSLRDYPLFQYLPSEVQAYILQYFGEDGGIGVVHPEALQIPQQTSLLANYPNPFNPETWIPYQLSKPTDVKLTIYDINGHVVRDLDLGHQRAGTYRSRSRAAHWDGKNESGESVASGVYFYKFTAGDFSATRKMLIRK